MQVKLLRLLQEREFRAVGSLTTRRVEIRVIAATHRDLGREIERNTFRQDLFYRLNVVTVRLPPLRERTEDIPLLVLRFLEGLKCLHRLSNDCMETLMTFDWPGNVRELQNCIERMVAMNSGPLLQSGDLPSALQTHLKARQPGRLSVAAAASGAVPIRVVPPSGIIPLMEVEKRAIFQALEYTKGDRAMAAFLLGIGRTTLYRKLKEYGLAV
jgi:DNA-binding NtrC family response regulator